MDASERSSPLEARERVDRALLDALDEGERPLLAIAFDAPRGDDEIRRRGIAETRDALVRLGGPELSVVAAPRSVPVFFARASRSSLERLLSDPRIRRIDRDESAGGGGLVEALPLAGFDTTHATGLDGDGAVIAVLDSGYDPSHRDLATALVNEACFCVGCCPGGADTLLGPGSSMDDHGHGSFVAGVITSDGLDAPAGALIDAEIVAVKVLDSANRFGSMMQIVEALDWVFVAAPEVTVVNLSLGTDQRFETACDEANAGFMALSDVIANLRGRGVVVVAAALNDADENAVSAPACIDGVIAVGSTDDGPPRIGQVSFFSNSGPLVDIFAPGSVIESVALGGGSRSDSGTSFSSPLVASCAALLQLDDPTRTPDDVLAALRSSPRTVTDTRNGLVFPSLDCGALLYTDLDGDGIEDDNDNCERVSNPDQRDENANGVGDLCDGCPEDRDGDEVCDPDDVCPRIADPEQRDADVDGIGDACDRCVLDALDDEDGDGACADIDNCPVMPNIDQLDSDGDGLGDACDPRPLDPSTGCGCRIAGGTSHHANPIALWIGVWSVLAIAFVRRRIRASRQLG